MSKKQFIKSQGATCDNWVWSWSFIDETNKIIIFGQWNRLTRYVGVPPLFSEDWETNSVAKRQAGYRQSREHIRLIEEEGYTLKTYPLIFSEAYHDSNGDGPARIAKFIPELTEKSLRREGRNWYASTEHQPDSSLRHGYEAAGPITAEDEAIYNRIWDDPKLKKSIFENSEEKYRMLVESEARYKAYVAKRKSSGGG